MLRLKLVTNGEAIAVNLRVFEPVERDESTFCQRKEGVENNL